MCVYVCVCTWVHAFLRVCMCKYVYAYVCMVLTLVHQMAKTYYKHQLECQLALSYMQVVLNYSVGIAVQYVYVNMDFF